MKVCLINPPWFFSTARAPRISHNLGLGYLASYLLRQDAHEVKFVDALAEGIQTATRVSLPSGVNAWRVGLRYSEIVDRIPPDTDLIGISCPFNYLARIVLELSEHIKTAYPGKRIVVGGQSTSNYSELFHSSALIDLVVLGEGEIPLSRLAQGEPAEQIPGVTSSDWTQEKRIAVREKAEIVKNLDDIPFPARELMPMSVYLSASQYGLRGGRHTSIITSRGCPFDCNFCSIFGAFSRVWRARSPDNVLSEIEHLSKRYGISHIEFEDDNLTLRRDRALAIFEGLQVLNKKGYGITWSTPNGVRVDTLDEPLLRAMNASGCLELSLAVEHGDPEILRAMNKRLDLTKVEDVVKICKQVGLTVHIFLMLAYPGETHESFLKSISFAEHLKKIGSISGFEINVTKPFAGTQVASYCEKQGYLRHQPGLELEELLALGDPCGMITTKDFDRQEVRRRARSANIKLNGLSFYVRSRVARLLQSAPLSVQNVASKFRT